MSAKLKQVVIAFDFSTGGQAALARGIELAGSAPSPVLHIVCVLDNAPVPQIPAPDGVDYRYAARVQDAMTPEIERRLRDAGIAARVHFFVYARIGKPGEEILNLAQEVGADMIVLGSNNLSTLERAVLGSVSEQVVRGAGCTVEVTRAKAYKDVTLLPIVEVAEDHHYVPPHRYFYEDNRINLRPADWPLY